MKTWYRIRTRDFKIKYAGTGHDSSFIDLETARKHCDTNLGEHVIETDGVNVLWEVC